MNKEIWLGALTFSSWLLLQDKEEAVRGNLSSTFNKLLSSYLAVTWHLLIEEKFIILWDFSQGPGQFIWLRPSVCQHSYQCWLVTWPPSMQGSWQDHPPAIGQGVVLTCRHPVNPLHKPPVFPRRCHGFGGVRKPHDVSPNWGGAMSECHQHKIRQFPAYGVQRVVPRCQYAKLTNCRPFWGKRQKLLHHKHQCPGNCSVPVRPWEVHSWDCPLVIYRISIAAFSFTKWWKVCNAQCNLAISDFSSITEMWNWGSLWKQQY